MKVVLTGATGMIGAALAEALSKQGHQVLRLNRQKSAQESQDGIIWDPQAGKIDASQLEGCDAIVHLAGEPVAQRWNDEVKSKIRNSRLESTKLLSKTIASLKSPPKVFVCASAIGFYGDRGAEAMTEQSSPGKGFLADLCQEWEKATEAASKTGIRTVNVRIGVVLSTKGGALAKMMPPFLIGAGGNLGSGKQYMSWISLDDVVEVISFAIQNDKISGPVNAVAPNPVTNAEFTKDFGKAIGRPTIFPVPAFGVQLLFGQMADEMLLTGAKVLPSKLESAGFKFRYPQLPEALKHALGKS